jgi:peptidoglycan/LPS O-acetylase OafA/YrhL
VLDSLSKHAYGIYLVHYVFVLWLGYALVGVSLNAPTKMMIVFSTALLLSWLTSAGIAAVVATLAKAPNKARAGRRAAAPPEGAITEQTR